MEELEAKLSEGVAQVDRGEGIAGEKVFAELRKRSGAAARVSKGRVGF
jgi:hypothetical protein